MASAATFVVGAAMPLAAVLLLPADMQVIGVSIASLAFLALPGAIAPAQGRQRAQGDVAHDLLGHARDGADCGHRQAVRHDGARLDGAVPPARPRGGWSAAAPGARYDASPSRSSASSRPGVQPAIAWKSAIRWAWS